jgi:hypothetical protein
MSTIVPGNKIFILGGASPSYGSPDYAVPSFYTFVSGDAAVGLIHFIGDPATPSNNGYNGRPLITVGGLTWYNGGDWIWDNLFLVAVGTVGNTTHGVLDSGVGDNIVRNCVYDQNGYDMALNNATGVFKFFNTEVYSSVAARGGATLAAVSFSHFGGNISFCNIHDCLQDGVALNGGGLFYIRNSIIAKNGGNGVTYTTISPHEQCALYDTTIDGNLGNGVSFSSPADLTKVAIANCIISNHTGSGKFGMTVGSTVTKAANDRLKCFMDYNTYYGNTNDFNNDLSYGPHDVHGGGNPFKGQSTENYDLATGVLTHNSAYPNSPFGQHLAGQTKTVQTYLLPGGGQPVPDRTPAVLSYTNALPGAPFPQHLSGQTTTVQNHMFPGAVQLAGAGLNGLVKGIFTLPGGMLKPVGIGVGAAAHGLLALKRNVKMTRRRAMGFIGWNKEDE